MSSHFLLDGVLSPLPGRESSRGGKKGTYWTAKLDPISYWMAFIRHYQGESPAEEVREAPIGQLK
jgi:hypothetical protein